MTLKARLAKLEAAQREQDAPPIEIRLWVADEDAGVWRDSLTGEEGNALTDEGGPRGLRGQGGPLADILISHGEGVSGIDFIEARTDREP